MALTFVFGPSGSGKSYYLYNHVIQESIKHPDRTYIVLVPEQFTLTTQRELVTLHPNKGIMNIDVLSFARLAFRIFGEVGVSELPMLDDEGKNLLLRKIAGNYDKELVMLRGNMKKQGYINEVKSIISEFTQYDISENEIDEMMSEVGEGNSLYYKLHDIKILYRGFKDYLEDKYITKEELLDRLCRVIDDSRIIRKSTIILDGYTGFTPVQNRVLAKLMKCGMDVMVSAVIDKNEDPYNYKHPYQLFGLTKRMVSSLIAIAEEEKVEINDSVKLFSDTSPRFRDNKELIFLENNIFRNRRTRYTKGQNSIKLLTASGPREEAFFAAGEIRRLIREQGLSYEDIGIVAADMDIYRDYLNQAMSEFDIPSFVDQKHDILNNPFIEFVRSFLGLFNEQFSYDSVFRFLKTQLTGFTESEVEIMENYCLGAGVKSYKKWQSTWKNGMGQADEELERLNHLRVRFVERLEPFRLILKERKKTVEDITRVLYEFMVSEELEEKLNISADEFELQDKKQLAFEYRRIYGVLMELLDKFVALLGDEEVGISEYIELFDAGLLEAKIGIIPQGISQIITGDLTRTRFDDIAVLFMLGASDDLLPGSLATQGVLSERDRLCFEENGYSLSPSSKEKAYTQKLYVYSQLTKPSKQLYVSYYRCNVSGNAVRPSYLISELEKLFDSIQTTNINEIPLYKREFTKELSLDYILEGLWRQEELSPELKELFAYFKREDRAITDEILSAYFRKNEIKNISKEIAKALYGEKFKSSITRMEKYSNCAYAHFLFYGLALREREEYEFEALDLGNICHYVLEKYAKKLYSDGIDWVSIDEETRGKLISDCIEEVVSDYKNDILFDSAKNKYMIEKIKKLTDRSVWALTKQLEPGDFKPAYYEFGFKDGKIDRIDLCKEDDKIYVKIIDYKTGAQKLEISSIYHGLKLQLMIYMDAARNIVEEQNPGKEVIPAGALYFIVDDPLIGKRDTIEQIEADKLKELKPTGVVNADEVTLSHFEPIKEGEFVTIPVKIKKDGHFAAGSKAYAGEELDVMMNYARYKVDKSRERILEGSTEASPFNCSYCEYADICGFDENISGYIKREVVKDADYDILSLMKGELESGD